MKKIYLLDTNIISEIVKPRPNKNVLGKIHACDSYCAISAVTWAELWYGVFRLPESKKRIGHEEFLTNKVCATYSIIPLDDHAAHLFGELKVETERLGRPRSSEDLQIAATAIANNLILVTRNTKDFAHIPSLMLENWFDADGG